MRDCGVDVNIDFDTAESPRLSPLSRYICGLIKESADKWPALPTLRGIGDGTLNPSVFRAYVEQDYLYLSYYATIYRRLAELSRGRQADTLNRMAENVLDVELALLAHATRRFGCNFQAAVASPVTQAYREFFDRFADDRSAMLVAMTPCIYGYVVALEPTAPSPGPYREWLNIYRGDRIAEMLSTHFELLNTAEMTTERALDIVLEALGLEEEFWNYPLLTIEVAP